ncbi:response regulator [Flavobacterium sp. PLA-1-15]
MMPEHKRKFKIAIADDDAEDREFFQEVLETITSEVELSVYMNGMELLKGLLDSKDDLPDLVFLDLNMPVMNGIAALTEIRNIDVFKKIPVIAIYSTSTSPKDQIDTFNLGADAYISKPNDYGVLKRVLQKVLEIDWTTWNKDKDNFIIDSN